MRLLIKNARLIDPQNNLNDIRDILVEGTKISRVAKDISLAADEIIEAADKFVLPGLVDMHAHLREPGREDKETILSGTSAALKGGITAVLAMPNTTPAIDSQESIELLKQRIKETARAEVLIAAAITKGRLGKELTDLSRIKKLGAVAITDDGASVDSDSLFLEALQEAKRQNLLVICHCEDKTLVSNGAMNLGTVSTCLGLRGIPKESEYKRIERDIGLARKTGAAIHIAHLSCRESVDIVFQAKKQGLRVSAETAPHYFSLTEEALYGYNTNMKVNPPLRTRDDVQAIKEGLRDGVIDVIASDHAPHTDNEKEIEFEHAEFGTVGLETLLAVSITELVNQGVLDWIGLAQKLTLNPRRILGLQKGTLEPGGEADIIIVSPDREWQVEKNGLLSKSKNSCFLGRRLKGAVECTIHCGKIVYRSSG